MTIKTVADVNTAFADERAQQLQQARDQQADLDRRVTDGTLIPLGGDRYRVNDPNSWDDGEVLHYRNGELLPQHGLDMSTGRAALYSAVPAWHGLGAIIPGGVTDIDEVLTLGRIAFTVEKVPSLYEWKGQVRTKRDKFTTVRTDRDEHNDLGVVGAKYHVVQNRDLFVFLEELVGQRGILWESAGALGNGSRVFVSTRVPDGITIDRDGLNDRIELFIMAVNSHDGSGQLEVVLTPWRPVCQNTERFGLRDATARWGIRHTSGAMSRI
ncbi:DUF932 domain-containing protein, partial [Actinomadura adrarensis]